MCFWLNLVFGFPLQLGGLEIDLVLFYVHQALRSIGLPFLAIKIF